MKTTTILIFAIALVGLSPSRPALAQNEGQLVLEEVMVTAQKREQSLQDVPITVSVVDELAMKNNVMTDVFNLQVTVPSLQVQAVDPPGQGTALALRGLGNSVFNMGFEPAVATFIDGVYRSRSGLAVANDFVDVSRVEVLKGPQGTLFGKNATAGVVHIINNRPDMESTYGEVQVDYTEYNRVGFKGFVNLPLNDRASLRFAGTHVKGGGWLDVMPNGPDIHDRDRWSFRASLLLKPTEDVTVLIAADTAQLDEICCSPLRNVNDPISYPVNIGAATAVGSTIIDPANLDNLQIDTNQVPLFDAKDHGISMQIDWDISEVTLTSITASRRYEDNNFKDNDFSGVDILVSNQNIPKVSLLSQELRLAGDGDRYSWMVGGYYAEEDLRVTNEFIWGSQITLFPFFAPGLFGNQPGRAFFHEFSQDVQSTALFAHGSYDVTDRFTMTAGLRYSRDEKDGSMVSDHPGGNIFGLPNAIPLPVVYDYEASTSDEEPTWTLSGQYAISDNIETFLTYSHGYKSGGISMTRDAAGSFLIFAPACPPETIPVGGPICVGAPQDPTFDKEESDNLELGIKTTLMGGRMRLNGAIWHTEFDGLQAQTLRPDGSFSVVNLDGATSQGVEADASFAITENLSATGAIQYLDATYNDGIPALTDAPGYLPLGGHRLPYASDWTGSIGLDYVLPVGGNGWDMLASGNIYSRSDYDTFTEPVVGRVQSSYSLLNLRFGFRNERWEVAAWCKNCSDERYRWSDFQIPFDGLVLGASTRWSHIGEPRIWGVSAIMSF